MINDKLLLFKSYTNKINKRNLVLIITLLKANL